MSRVSLVTSRWEDLSPSSLNPVNDTGQWHECRHSCHWPVVNDTDACIRVIDHGQWHLWMHSCHWPPVNDIFECIRVIDHQSMTPVKAFVSLTTSQWHLWMHLCHWPLFNDKNALSVMSYMHSCHWPIPKEGWLSLSREAPSCIRVIDHWSMTRMHWVWFTISYMHSCHWPNCIRVIDQTAFVSLTKLHSCHWPNCIRVIDQTAFCLLYTSPSPRD